MRRAAERDAAYPTVVFVSMSPPDDARPVFDEFWPAARVVCDPDKTLYQAFGLSRGSLGQLFGPKAVAAGIRAVFKGHGIGRPRGDTLQMSGAFVIENETVVWIHEYRHAGDHPFFPALGTASAPAEG